MKIGVIGPLRAPALSVVLLISGVRLEAKPDYLDLWNEKYPESTLPARMERETGSSCTVCHSLKGFKYDLPGNCYRDCLHQLMHEIGGMGYFRAALDAADLLDSDADGVPNGIEILSERPDGEVGYHPGLAGDTGVDRCGASGDEVVSHSPETPPLEPGILAVPQLVSFGDLASGQVRQRIFAFRNAGSVDRTVTGLSIGRGTHIGYSVEAVGPIPRVLAPGEELAVLATCQASYGGYFYQQLAWPEITTDDPYRRRVFALLRPRRGYTGIAFSSSVDLGIAAVGEVKEGSLTISNGGERAVTIQGARWDAGAHFEVVEDVAGRTIDAKESLGVGLRYFAADEGVHEDLLTIETDDPFDGQLFVSVVGEERHRLTLGDANLDGGIDLGDAIAVLWALFVVADHPCREALDANDNGAANIADAVHILGLLFLDEGPLPQECRLDPSSNYLGCPGGSPPCSP